MFSTPVGKLAVVVVTVRAGAVMVMLRFACAVSPVGVCESVTVTVKFVVAVVAVPVGMPEITPVVVFSVNPGGRLALPPVTAQDL